MKVVINVCDSYSINCSKDCYHKRPHTDDYKGTCKAGSYCNYRKKDTKCNRLVLYSKDEFDHLYVKDELMDYC